MATYDLQRLGGMGFQDVVAALAIRLFGPHVRPMGRGRDGGRDLLINGNLVWASTEDNEHAEVWSGRTIFQIKHKETLQDPQKDLSWFWNNIKAELDSWCDPSSKRGAMPDYLVFATNVALTPVPGSGGFDIINTRIREYRETLNDESSEDGLPSSDQREARARRHARRDRMKRLCGWRLWDGNQLIGLLDAYEQVRRGFNSFLTAGDVLADLSMLSTSVDQEQLGKALRNHARSALMSDRRVYFDDAGGETKGVPVETVVIDLPVLVGNLSTKARVIRYVLDRGERVLRPSVTVFGKPRHLVITGAPGNGKSTVAKFLTHVYRAAFVDESQDLGDEHRRTVDGTKSALRNMDIRMPANRRWPINIDLAKFALEQATNSDYTLLNGIADIVNRQVVSKSIPRWELDEWLRHWPSFIVLDGLDEVAEPSVRQTLISNIDAFVAEAESENWDVLVVVTTRPTGYEDEMSTSVFERIDLADLTVEDAVRYGQLVTKVRVLEDQDRQDGIISVLKEAAADERVRHLLRTPLQVLIMSIIAESSGQFSPSRFALFWGYYQAIEQREKNKKLAYSQLLRDHSSQVLDLHRQVGLLLQHQAETATGTDAVLSPDKLREVAWHVLNDAGYEPSNRDRILLDRILNAATHRLLLLVPKPGGGYGFDVRSLQELMAAHALTTGALDETIPKLRQIGASPHWRNTFLFAAGRYFSEPQPHQKKEITSLILDLDSNASERLGSVFPIGPNLAMEIIDDGMVSEPKYLHPLVTHALEALHEPAGFEVTGYARMLMSVASKSGAVRELISAGLRDALGGSSTSRENAEAVKQAISVIGRATEARVEVLGLSKVKRNTSKPLPVESGADWAEFSHTLEIYSETETDDAVRNLAVLLNRVQKTNGFRGQQLDDLTDFLDSADNAFILEEALRHIKSGAPSIMKVLRHDLLPALWRRPVDVDH
ncbi:NACHT domain-containing protein [Brevibacterium oceani]|uniref:NACHT domain-containing protein n=1 Tax=Brevibacterium oceani TaxID=358099 RepID=UPI0015E640DB|nr:hypothetical protein [Brevibacterium oceani]